MNFPENFKVFFKSFHTFIKQHNEFYRKKLQHRCEVVRVQKNLQTNQSEILVRMSGVKKHSVVKFSPEEILVNDDLLMEFSQTDVRAITYCALQNEKAKQIQPSYKYKVVSQEFFGNETLFVIAEEGIIGEIRIAAHELFGSDILQEFNFEDMRNIIYTATTEQLQMDYSQLEVSNGG